MCTQIRCFGLAILVATAGWGPDGPGLEHPGQLDPTFGVAGKVVVEGLRTWVDNPGAGLALQPDGRILLAAMRQIGPGSSDTAFAVVRLNADGSLDGSFGSAGEVAVEFGPGQDGANAVAVQSDGRIVVAGTSSTPHVYSFGVTRLLPDGALDLGFGSGGMVTFYPPSSFNSGSRDVALGPNGAIFVSGFSDGSTRNDFGVLKLRSDGFPDPSFDGDGWVSTNIGLWDTANAVRVLPDGRLLVAGGSDGAAAVARYLPDGRLDPGLGGDGIVTTYLGDSPFEGAVGLGRSLFGGIVVSGTGAWETQARKEDFAVIRYTWDGDLDSSFGQGGLVATNFVTQDGVGSTDIGSNLAVQEDGRIVVVGYTEGPFAVARYGLDGRLDTTFGRRGRVLTAVGGPGGDHAYRVVLQADGKIVVAGDADRSDLGVVRYIGG